jgi:type III secretion protein J
MRRIAFISWLVLLVSGCTTELQGGLEEREANQLVLALAGKGIDARKSCQGNPDSGQWTVRVPDDDLFRAWRVLHASGLPRPRHVGFMGVYRERALVPGKMEERALYLSALQEEIAKTLESVEGVYAARVHVTLKADGRFGARSDSPESTASVLVSHRGESPPIPEENVQKMVAHAVSGLKPAQVAVVFSPRRPVVFAGSTGEGAGGEGFRFGMAGALVAAVLLASILATRVLGRRLAKLSFSRSNRRKP